MADDKDENRKLLAAINAACAEPETPEAVELRRRMRERLRRRLEADQETWERDPGSQQRIK